MHHPSPVSARLRRVVATASATAALLAAGALPAAADDPVDFGHTDEIVVEGSSDDEEVDVLSLDATIYEAVRDWWNDLDLPWAPTGPTSGDDTPDDEEVDPCDGIAAQMERYADIRLDTSGGDMVVRLMEEGLPAEDALAVSKAKYVLAQNALARAAARFDALGCADEAE